MRLKTKVAKGLAKICGAKNRRGLPCQCKLVYRGGKCKFHGGLSTGAKTPEGKRKSIEAMRNGWLRWRQERASAALSSGDRVRLAKKAAEKRWSEAATD